MNAILWTSKDMPLFYEALRDQFNRGDTLQSVLITVGVFALLIGVVVVLTRIDQRKQVTEEPDHPARVFRETLHKLGFPPSQQKVFETMVGETKPPHPSALLLSEKELVDLTRCRRIGRNTDPKFHAFRLSSSSSLGFHHR